MKKTILVSILFIALAVIATGCNKKQVADTLTDDSKTAGESMQKKDEETAVMMEDEGASKDAMIKEVDEEMVMEMKKMTFQYSGKLSDVTEDQEVEGIDTGGNATGIAQATFSDGKYNLMATFENLPDPQGSDFYEGWVVRKQPFHFISTGVANKTNGVYENHYVSGDDLTDHDFYVLTIEPDDGDPAPAGHILEGTMVKIN